MKIHKSAFKSGFSLSRVVTRITERTDITGMMQSLSGHWLLKLCTQQLNFPSARGKPCLSPRRWKTNFYFLMRSWQAIWLNRRGKAVWSRRGEYKYQYKCNLFCMCYIAPGTHFRGGVKNFLHAEMPALNRKRGKFDIQTVFITLVLFLL